MDPARSLHWLRDALMPPPGGQERIKARLQAQINTSPALLRAKNIATPSIIIRKNIWEQILNGIEPGLTVSLLTKLRDLLVPPMGLSVRLRLALLSAIAPRGATADALVPSPYRGLKWVAAFVVVVIILRATPLLFIAAPRSSAKSVVLVVPTYGYLSVSLRGLWEPVTRELMLQHPGAQFRTGQGEATFILNDDGNLRMARQTILTLHDVSNRPEPALPGPTLTLLQGRIWVQGLVPGHLRGITVATPDGDITVHEGSVSITVSDGTDVHVWDRHARVTRTEGRELLLVAGERAELHDGTTPLVKKIVLREYDETWPSQNLARDAVHRREIAQLQQERTTARAGILPTSPLYSVKRVAEVVDDLLTFDERERVEKRLQHASTRLDEAAALIAEGGSGAKTTAVLDEYRSTLLAVATGSGQGSVAQFLLRQQVAEDAAQVAAALPDDSLYLIKKTVLEASADLPTFMVDAQNVQGVLLLDALGSVQQAVQGGDISRAQEVLSQVQPRLEALQGNDGTIPPGVKKEALSLLTFVANELEETQLPEKDAAAREAFLQEVERYLPPPTMARTPITEGEAQTIVQGIKDRVFLFKLPRPRWSQLMYELKKLHEHPDEGTLLRHLYRILPENGLARYVRTAIVELGQRRGREQ